MKKLNVSDAAAYFGVSKEAIHNRVRRSSLEVVVENGIKMVLINEDTKAKVVKKSASILSSSKNDERYYKLLQEQNEKLQFKVEKLEGETRMLRDQKELMLIEEKKKIEAIYKEKDEQLKNILSTLSSQFMQLQEKPAEIVDTSEAVEVEIEEVESSKNENIISLKKYLKSKNFSEKKLKRVRKVFLKKAKKDTRIITVEGKLFVNPAKHSYSDLF